MRYLVTGATGFAGPHLINLLIEQGHEVYGLIRCSNGRQTDIIDIVGDNFKNINWCYSNLCNINSLSEIFKNIQFDGVFHLAAQSHPAISFTHPIETFESNIMGSVNLITCIEKYQKNCLFHFCSTSEVYGDTCKDNGILYEDSILSPCNPYGVSKTSIDIYVQERIKNKKIKGFITRAFSHTGPRRGYNFSISSDAYQIVKIMKGLQDKNLLVGNLKTERVVMDVRDCVQAYYLLMKNKCSGIFNICGNTVHLMQYFTDKLIELSNIKDIKQVIHLPFYRNIDIQVQIGNCKKLKEAVNWEQQIPIDITLKDLLEYWRQKI